MNRYAGLWLYRGTVVVAFIALMGAILAHTKASAEAQEQACPAKFQKQEQVLNSESVLEIADPARAEAFINAVEANFGPNPLSYPGDENDIADLVIHKWGSIAAVSVYDSNGCEVWTAAMSPSAAKAFLKSLADGEV